MEDFQKQEPKKPNQEEVIEGLIGEKVTVYFNLHKKLWSIKHKGKVKAHVKEVFLKPEKFHVNENQRQKVIKNKCRMVHAWINGTLMKKPEQAKSKGRPISYNPYRMGSFYRVNEDGSKTPTTASNTNALYFDSLSRKCFEI